MLPEGFNPEDTDQTHDYQAIGAQAVNNVLNKLMLAMFAPSRPFFKGDVGEKTETQAQNAGIDKLDIRSILSSIERKAVAKLDELGQRPKLYQTLGNLVVTGNSLLIAEKEQLRVMGLRYWCVKRTITGKMHTLIIKESVKFDELEPAVREAAGMYGPTDPDSLVDFYKMICLSENGKNYEMTQWVGAAKLPTEFDGRWPTDKCPYHALAWNLADESDYGTGLVEEYAADLEAASILSEGMVNGGVLGAEFRWLVDPAGMTSADDVNKSKNGDALAGREKDITPTQGGNPEAIAQIANVLDRYERRIGRAFLMGSAVTRDAERVTAEEVRLTANELEMSYGGVYSQLSTTLQLPIAWWLLAMVDKSALKADLKLTVITGLGALSRNGDLENLRLALQDLAELSNVPPLLQERINWDAITKYVGQGRGVEMNDFLLSDEQVKANRAAAAQAEVATQTGIAAGQAAVQPQEPTGA
jgi:hypothetical protein